MAVITVAQIERDLSRGYDNPSLPIGIWRVSQQSVGDASGGTNTIQIELKSAATPVGNLFSLEELGWDDQDATALDFAFMSFAGMEVYRPGLFVRTFAIPGFTPSGTADNISPPTKPQIFVGQAANAATAGTISISVDNTNGLEFEVNASGYMWTPRSLMEQGGPSRPIQGRFPN